MSLRAMGLRDFVIVRSLDLEFSNGLSVLTGETGAGKSILIDALQLALGERADAGVVREGATRCEISAEFDTTAPVQLWLQAAGFEAGDSLLLKRTIDAQGKSRAWINGSAATATQLREVSEWLVDIHGQHFWVLPPEAGLTFLVDVAVPYVEAVFLRGMPFLGTVSFNAQAQQISPDLAKFTYGALYADPLPSMGAGIPPSLLMQDMYRHLPEKLHQWYLERTRGEGDVRVKICMSFQKSMFCVTNAAINGTMPHPLGSSDPEAHAANEAYAEAWAQRLGIARTDCLAA